MKKKAKYRRLTPEDVRRITKKILKSPEAVEKCYNAVTKSTNE